MEFAYAREERMFLVLLLELNGVMTSVGYTNNSIFFQAVTIQKYVRGWLARKQFKQKIRHIVICQAAVRRYLARKQYKKLRIEARSIEHVKKLNKGLENKIISLQQKIETLNKTNHELKNYQNEVHELK